MRRLTLTPLFLLLLTVGCDTGGAYAQADYEREVDDAVAALDAALGRQASTVSACRVLPVGEKACGGPRFFRPYSATDTDSAEVERLAERVAEIDRKAIRELGLASDCQEEIPPAVVLEEGQCRFETSTVVN